jgi:zinc finger CCHC domain-containing protein 8
LEEEICVLDSCASSGGSRNRERSMGRTDCDESSPGSMGKDIGGTAGSRELDDSQLFYVDTRPSYIGDAEKEWGFPDSCVYTRSEKVLGDENVDEWKYRSSRCFNCGSTDHMVASCGSPLDYQVIALSRQIYTSLWGSRGIDKKPDRVHVVEGWKRQRLEWLDMFEPGEVRSRLLKEAIGVDEDDAPWLENMGIWGYPRGWYCDVDPRDEVRRRIKEEYEEEDEGIILDIIGEETDNNERIKSTESAEVILAKKRTISEQRWAVYPLTRFCSERLTIYSGFALPSVISTII